jgi:ribosomal-protein-alanine N-acetyltransferase
LVTCATPEGSRVIHFGPDWPGEPLVFFPRLLDRLDDAEAVENSFTVVDRKAGEAIGEVGTKGTADADGVVEIGYGLVPGARGRGLATEAVGALVDHLLSLDGITGVTAHTAMDNVASQRVLAKTGFRRIGTSWTRDDGDLITWARA